MPMAPTSGRSFPGLSSTLSAVSPDGSKVIVRDRRVRRRPHLRDRHDRGRARAPRYPLRCDVFRGLTASSSRRTGAGWPSSVRATDETAVIAIMDRRFGCRSKRSSRRSASPRPRAGRADGRASPSITTWSIRTAATSDRSHLPTLFSGLFGEPGFGYSAPQWSPDDSLIAFASFNDTFPTNPPNATPNDSWTSTWSDLTASTFSD